MTQSQDEAIARAARLLAGALSELQHAGQNGAGLQDELARQRSAIDSLGERLERQLVEDRQQRAQFAGQLANLAGSLDRLVTHLEGMSNLMSDVMERLAAQHVPSPAPQAAPPAPSAPQEPMFHPGGEGIALAVAGVPGFQALMEIQKALLVLAQVSSASVERFQEGESRLQVHLSAPITASQLADALGQATGHPLTVEESRPELMRLKLKVLT